MDLLQEPEKGEPFAIVSGRRLAGRVIGLFTTAGEGFATAPVSALDLTFEGIAGARHAGLTRRSGGREPWYPRGTEMRNERQLSILAEDELAAVAARMAIERIDPTWIGANMTIEGVPHLSMLPPRTLLFFEGGATLRVDGQNAPCRIAGAEIARRYPDSEGLDLFFPKAAKRLRGLVAWVEKPGRVEAGSSIKVQVPEQWIYDPGA